MNISRHPGRRTLLRPGTGALLRLFALHINVLTLAPALIEAEPSGTRSLLDRAQAGDADAFCELSRAYETPLLRQAMMVCGNATLAEELAQDTLVEAWKCLRRYNGRCRLFTWLCAILLNRYRNTLREKRPVPVSSLQREDRDGVQNSVELLIDDSSPPDEAEQLREQAAVVLQCVHALSPKYQRVIHLRFYVDDSLESIAAALGCSVGTVKSRLFRALNKLRLMNALDPNLRAPKGKM
jgi:RNA polymerase sigma-70 factor, ECF subfamily